MRCFAFVAALFLAGCASSPRFVHQDANSAVVAMPHDSNCWPSYYRDNADKMLRARFPQGYVVEKEEEFVTGVSTHTTGQSRTEEAPTLMLGGGSRNGNGNSSSRSFGGIAVPVGETRQRVTSDTTTSNQTEWRMYVRAK